MSIAPVASFAPAIGRSATKGSAPTERVPGIPPSYKHFASTRQGEDGKDSSAELGLAIDFSKVEWLHPVAIAPGSVSSRGLAGLFGQSR